MRCGRLLLSAQLLFHSSYISFLGVAVGLALHWLYLLWRGGERATGNSAGIACGVTLLSTVPWVIFIEGWKRSNPFEESSLPFLERTAQILKTLLLDTNAYLFPLLLLPPLLLILAKRRGPDLALPAFQILGTWLLLAVQPWSYFRYSIGLLPVFALLAAVVVSELWGRSRALGAALLAALLFTNAASLSLPPYALRFDLASHLYELTHEYRGPNEAIVDYLREHGSEDDFVLTNYGELPIIFYTGMRAVGFGQDLRVREQPDWIIPRHGRGAADFLRRRAAGYDRVVLDAVDIPWGNRPDPTYHKYRTVTNGPRVEIFRKPRR